MNPLRHVPPYLPAVSATAPHEPASTSESVTPAVVPDTETLLVEACVLVVETSTELMAALAVPSSFVPVRMSCCSGVAFGAGGLGVAVDFVEENDAAADATEAARGVGADQAERAAGELLLQDGVGAILRFGLADEPAETGGVAQHGGDLLLGVALGVLDGGLDQHDGCRILMDVIGNDVIEDFGVTNSRRFHYSYLFDVITTYCVHNSLLIG